MISQAGSQTLCVVQSNLAEVSEREFELKNKRCWQGKRYYLARFDVRVIIAPANLYFELWFKGGKYSMFTRKRSSRQRTSVVMRRLLTSLFFADRSHDPVTIEWDQAGASARPPSEKGLNTQDAWESAANRPMPGRFRGSL
jgi:hypothetical protein